MAAPTQSSARSTPPGESGGSGGGRIFGVLLGLLVAVAAAYVFLAAVGAADPRFLARVGFPVARLADKSMPGFRAAVAAGSLVIGLLALALMFRGGGKPVSNVHVLTADERGLVVVDNRGVCTVAAEAARRSPGVLGVTARVTGTGAAPVRVELTLSASAAAELKNVGDAARTTAADAIERLIGLKVQDVIVKILVVPLEELGRRVE